MVGWQVPLCSMMGWQVPLVRGDLGWQVLLCNVVGWVLTLIWVVYTTMTTVNKEGALANL